MGPFIWIFLWTNEKCVKGTSNICVSLVFLSLILWLSENFEFVFFPADIGQEVHRRAQERFSQDRECAIRRAEEAVWSQAEVMTREAVENAIRKCRSDHEKAVRKLHKAHEKAIKVGFLLKLSCDWFIGA